LTDRAVESGVIEFDESEAEVALVLR